MLFAVYAQPILADAPESQGKKAKRRIRLKEIKQHGADSKDGIWVSRGENSHYNVNSETNKQVTGTSVYDITEWIESHPGGSVIMRAAGGALEPYWSVFSFHGRPDILEILEDFRIGEVSS